MKKLQLLLSILLLSTSFTTFAGGIVCYQFDPIVTGGGEVDRKVKLAPNDYGRYDFQFQSTSREFMLRGLSCEIMGLQASCSNISGDAVRFDGSNGGVIEVTANNNNEPVLETLFSVRNCKVF